MHSSSRGELDEAVFVAVAVGGVRAEKEAKSSRDAAHRNFQRKRHLNHQGIELLSEKLRIQTDLP